MAADETRDGVDLTHLDAPLADDEAVSKRALVDYLDTMSSRLLPALRDRPLSVIRVRPGQGGFMQKNLPKYAPSWIATESYWAERSKRTVTYPLCNDRRTLLWLANQRAVEYQTDSVPDGRRRASDLSRARHRPAGGQRVRRRD